MFRNASLTKVYKKYLKSVQTFTDKINTTHLEKCIKPLQMKTSQIISAEKFNTCRTKLFAAEYNLSLKYANFCDNLQKHRKVKVNNIQSNQILNETLLRRKARLFTFGSAAALVNNKTAATNDETVASSSETVNDSLISELIPEPPPIPDIVAETTNQLNALGEPTFVSLGLGGWTPAGIVQHAFEYLHVTLGIPWWEAILIGTIVIRLAMFPLVIIAQRNAAKMNNYLPQLQTLQLKMTEARQTGNKLEAARLSQEMVQFMQEKNLNPMKNMVVPLAQMPVFISFFIGLRQMANLPVESLRTGGLFWFQDLTVPDQFFAMPIITSLTLWATIELGTDGTKVSAQMNIMRYVLRALPVVILPFTINFPGAILCYWVSSNFISLLQVGILKIPAVRDYFRIDPLISHKPDYLPIKPKGFTEGLKDSWENMKITREIEERQRLNDMQFKRAGKGPIVKTYKYDPTKTTRTAVSAKER